MRILKHLWSVMAMLAVVCLYAPAARAQTGGAIQSITFGPMGTPKGGVAVTVCTSGASVVGGVCTPAESDANCCFTDGTLTVRLAVPAAPNQLATVVSDGLGNFTVWAAPGTYQVSYSGAGVTPKTTVAAVACVPGNSANCGALLGVANTWSALQTFNLGLTSVGPSIFSGNVTATAGQNTFNFFQHNNVLWCNQGAAYKYTTLSGCLAATECPAIGCNVNLVSAYNETFTSNIKVGNGTTNFFHVQGYPGTGLICNITTGGQCITQESRTSFTGQVLGGVSSNNPGGFQLSLASTANISSLLGTDATVTGGTAYMRAENLFLWGNPSATISTAMFDIGQANTMNSYHNIYAANYSGTIGAHIHSVNVSGGQLGPLNMDNIWSLGGYNTNSRPCVLEALGTTALNISWVGGVCNQPGSGKAMFEMNGNGTACLLRGVNAQGVYLENLNNGSSIGYKVADTCAVHISGAATTVRDTDTIVDISQSVTHGALAIQATGLYQASPTNLATLVNNHITGHTITGAALPFYNFGGDVGASIADFTIESNNFSIFDAANHQIVSIPAQSSTGVNPTFFNGADALYQLSLNSGLTATQGTLLRVLDRGTEEWRVFQKDTSNNLILAQDSTHSFQSRMVWPQVANVAASGQIRFASTEGIGWRNNANGADILLAKNATDGLTFNAKAFVDSTGHLVQTATGQYAGTCSMSAGTTCTFSLSTAFTGTPLGFASISGAPGATAFSGSCAISSTTVTITANAANSLAWNCLLVGNPN